MIINPYRFGQDIPFSNVNSFSFDGVDDYFLGTSTYSELDGQSKVTISAWIKVETNTDTTSYLCSIEGGSAFTIGIRLQTTTSTLCWVYVNGAGNNSRAFANIGTIKNDGLWHHFVVCLDLSLPNTQECQIYLDNVAQSMSGYFAGSTLPNANSGLFIGNRNSTFSGQFGGKVDELAIWSGTDLRNDVATIYNNGEPTDLNNNGLTAPTTWQRMGEDATWNGAIWTMTDVNGGYSNRSINMVEANRTTDVPPNPFANTQSVLLDGVDDYVDCSNPSNLNFSADDAFSFSVWFKKSSDSNYHQIINKRLGAPNRNGYVLFIDSDSKVNFIIRESNINFHQIIDNNAHPIDTWVHYVVTYDGSRTGSGGGLNLYKNGTLLTNVTKSGNFSSGTGQSTANFAIGIREVDSASPFNGTIDEVSIFNSELSQSDITSIYGGGVPSSLSSYSSLVSWWRFEGTGTTAIDSGSGGNNGTLTNGLTRSTDVPT